MTRQRCVAAQRRHLARPHALIGNRVFVPHTDRKSRIVIKEKRGRMVIEKKHQNVGCLFFQPASDRGVAGKQRRPVGVFVLLAIVGQSDRWHMRCANATNDFCHAVHLPSIGRFKLTADSARVQPRGPLAFA